MCQKTTMTRTKRVNAKRQAAALDFQGQEGNRDEGRAGTLSALEGKEIDM